MDMQDLEKLAQRYAEIEQLIVDPDVISNGQRYASLLRERGGMRTRVENYNAWREAQKELDEARGIAEDPEQDQDFRELAAAEVEELSAKVEQQYENLLSALASEDEYSGRNVILEIRAGTGGDEAALFVADLLRMYRLWGERRGWQLEFMDASPTELGGYKEVILTVKGEDAYSRLRYEGGGHRVQRVPKTETQGRIHTSAATVAVMPEAEEVEVDIDQNDLEVSVMRSQGPGGQSVNTTDSAVRILHKPTGIAVKCQVHKSQHQNRDMALRLLQSKLYEIEQEKADSERKQQRINQMGSGDRSQRIRTYNFPQNRVTDHRMEGDDKNFPLQSVLEGDVDPIVDKLLELEKLRLRAS